MATTYIKNADDEWLRLTYDMSGRRDWSWTHNQKEAFSVIDSDWLMKWFLKDAGMKKFLRGYCWSYEMVE